MKAKNLMLGDWIYKDGYNHPLRISQVNNGSVCVEEYFSTNEGTRKQEYVIEEEYIEPIPLTAEILEKNGFGSENILGDRSSVPFLMQVFDENHIVMYQKPFEYVQKLQQALRLCGLNELADNFKV